MCSVLSALHDGAELRFLEQLYYFARDDRVYKAFVERLNMNRNSVNERVGKQLRSQLRLLERILQGRNTTWRVRTFSITMLCI